MWAVYTKEKNVHCPSLIPSPYNVFFYFLEGQVHENSKLGIMTKPSLKIIHKIIDACGNSFGRYIMTAQCMRSIFTFY